MTFGGPPDFLVSAVRDTVRDDPAFQQWLYQRGRDAATGALLIGGASRPKTPPSPWWQFVDPVLDPFERGFRDRALPAVTLVAAGLLGLGFLIGRRT